MAQLIPLCITIFVEMDKQENTNKFRRSFLKKLFLAGASATNLPGITWSHTLVFSRPQGPKPGSLNTPSSDNGYGYTILFQGDSITDGGRSHDMDWNHLMGSGYVYILSSSLWFHYPNKHFHFINRGVGGNKITDLAARWQKDTIDIKSDVLNILVGVNDANSVVDNNKDIVDSIKYEDEYRNLLQQTKEKLPDVKLILCEPFILPFGHTKDNYPQWLDEIKKRQATVLKLSKEFDTMYVNFQSVFNEVLKIAPVDYWIWDGIHPMPAGHQLMAKHWTEVVHKQFPFIK